MPKQPSTKQACKFRDEYAAFQDVGAHVFGISSDSPAANKAFAEAQRLPFPLLTDPAGALRKVWVKKGCRVVLHVGSFFWAVVV